MRDEIFALAAPVRLRREAFGGIVFHQNTGRLIEVDAEGFDALSLMAEIGPLTLRDLRSAVAQHLRRRVPAPELANFLAALVAREVVITHDTDSGTDTRKRRAHSVSPWRAPDLPALARVPEDSALSAPIAVHWALTYACNLACPHCYAPTRRAVRSGTGHEMTRAEKLRTVERLATWGVLEVPLGGGEPTLSRDLEVVLRAIRAAGMVPHVTTNDQHITPELAALLAETCGWVQVSLDRPEILDVYRGRGAARRALLAVERLQGVGAHIGVNLLLVPENLAGVDRSLRFLEEAGIRRVVLLRPYGNAGGRWPAGWPGESEWGRLRHALTGWTAGAPHQTLEVACGLSFLLDDLQPEQRRARLAYGCAGGQRFMAMHPDGSLWRCSHERQPALPLGQVLRDDLSVIWPAPAADVKSSLRLCGDSGQVKTN